MIKTINISSQNNFCGYYALARRIINDKNFALILDKFNQFYQTNWYFDELVEVIGRMNSEQADIMLGLVIHNACPLDTIEGLSFEDLDVIYKMFGYNISIFSENLECVLDSSEDAAQDQLEFRKILILYEASKDGAGIGHYNLIEPNEEAVVMDASLRDPSYQGLYTINNQGGEQFIDNVKKSVAEIKPRWSDPLKEQLLKLDEKLALEFAITDARAENLRFFKIPRTKLEEKTQLIELQRKEIEYYNNKRLSR